MARILPAPPAPRNFRWIVEFAFPAAKRGPCSFHREEMSRVSRSDFSLNYGVRGLGGQLETARSSRQYRPPYSSRLAGRGALYLSHKLLGPVWCRAPARPASHTRAEGRAGGWRAPQSPPPGRRRGGLRFAAGRSAAMMSGAGERCGGAGARPRRFWRVMLNGRADPIVIPIIRSAA